MIAQCVVEMIGKRVESRLEFFSSELLQSCTYAICWFISRLRHYTHSPLARMGNSCRMAVIKSYTEGEFKGDPFISDPDFKHRRGIIFLELLLYIVVIPVPVTIIN